MKFIDFLQGSAPTKTKYARKLVTADHKANIGDFKHNYIMEIAPICKDDLVVLPKDLAHQLSNIRRLVLVKRVGAGIHVIDPLTGEVPSQHARRCSLRTPDSVSFTTITTEKRVRE